MNLKVSGYKQLFLVITAFLCIIVTVIVASASLPEHQSLNTVIAVILSLALLLIVFFVHDKYFMRVVFSFYNEENEPDYFMIYAAKIISLDSHFSKEERKKVLKYMDYNYGPEYTKTKIINLELIISEIDSIFPRFRYPTKYTRIDKLRLLQNVVGLAVTDRFLSNKELKFIKKTAEIFKCSENDLDVIFRIYNYVTEEETEYQRMMNVKPNYSLQKAYTILGIKPEATQDEVKAAYRELAKIFHPDKSKSPEAKKKAKIQFQAISDAYEMIKKERGV